MKCRLPLKALTALGLLIVSTIFCLYLNNGSAFALSGSDWQPGHILDDVVLHNTNTLTAGDIQTFLNNKLPACDTNGAQSISYYLNSSTGEVHFASSTYPANTTNTRAVFGQQFAAYYNNHPYSGYFTNESLTPFVCLKDYSQNVSAMSADAYCSAISGGTMSAAQIIKAVSTACGINPEVLIVILQKEQGLVTDDWPWTNEYEFATGFCVYDDPNSVPPSCQGTSGYFNQVYYAARQFNMYAASPSNYNYQAGQTASIPYSTSSSCGSSNVYIQSQATADLYNYTPYQPNAGALAGLSDSSPGGTATCGSYGNRNFWWYFWEWFGPPIVAAYSWQYVDQGAYTDSSMSTPVDLNSIVVGSRYYLVIHAKNVGTATWNQGYVNLGTSQPNDRTSSLYDSTWPSKNRAATLLESSVAPGATGTFGFWVTVSKTGSYKEYFNLVAENFTWMTDYGLYWQFGVQPQRYSWLWTGQNAYTDSSKTTAANLNNVVAGSRVYLTLQGKNTGNVSWRQNYLNLGTWQPTDRSSLFHDNTWPSSNRAATIEQTSVDPNQIGSFGFWVTIPMTPGTYKEYFDPVAEGISWLNDYGVYWQFTVQPQRYSWLWTGQNAYTDSSKAAQADLSNLSAGSRVFLTLQGTNTGNMPWKQNYINLGTWRPNDRTSLFYDSTWPSINRAATIDQTTVVPGQSATFGFWVTAPSTPGTYKEYFDPVAEGITWMNDYGLYWQFTVH